MSKQDELIVSRLVDYLNGLLAVDRAAVNELLSHRVTVNTGMTCYRGVQLDSDGKLGLLGILNGFIGESKKYGGGRIMMVETTDGVEIKAFIDIERMEKIRISRVDIPEAGC